jgi:hypothetical protein
MSSRTRLFVAWFCVGVALPPAIYGLGALVGLAGAEQAGRIFALVAAGGCPFWVLIWIPAMSQPNNSILFYSAIAAILIANGCLYLLMAQLQSKIQSWSKTTRIATLSIAYPVLMALGYSLPLALEAV